MIGNIEQAIIDVFSKALENNKLGYKIDKIAGYKGEFSNVKELLGSCRSAVLVAFGGKSLSKEFAFSRQYEATFLVEVYSRNSTRNEKDARFGTKDTVGAYQLAEDVEVLLHNNNLNLLSSPLKLQSMNPVFNTSLSGFHVGAYELEFKCLYEIHQNNIDYDDLNPFETLVTTWDMPEKQETILKLPQETGEKADGK